MTASTAAEARLAVIDMQRIFAAGPWSAPRFAEIVLPVRHLVDRFGERSIFTRFVIPTEPAGSWHDYYERWPFAVQPAAAPEYGLIDEFRERDTVDATTFGKWPALRDRLGLAAGDRLVVCGVSTECCVLTTVLAAADAGLHVQVVPEACAGVDDGSHTRALDLLALFAPQVEVVALDDVTA